VKMSRYSCLKCGLEFDAPWYGGAFLTAMECTRCGETAITSKSLVFESGCLIVQDEKTLANTTILQVP